MTDSLWDVWTFHQQDGYKIKAARPLLMETGKSQTVTFTALLWPSKLLGTAKIERQEKSTGLPVGGKAKGPWPYVSCNSCPSS